MFNEVLGTAYKRRATLLLFIRLQIRITVVLLNSVHATGLLLLLLHQQALSMLLHLLSEKREELHS